MTLSVLPKAAQTKHMLLYVCTTIRYSLTRRARSCDAGTAALFVWETLTGIFGTLNVFGGGIRLPSYVQ